MVNIEDLYQEFLNEKLLMLKSHKATLEKMFWESRALEEYRQICKEITETKNKMIK